MKRSNKQTYIWIIVLIVAVAAGLWGVFGGEQGAQPGDNSSDNGDQADVVETISWNESEIRDQDKNVLISKDDVPRSMQVNKDSEFGVGGSFTDAKLSSDKSKIAFTASGAVHGGGWIAELGQGTSSQAKVSDISPVAFQYGGGVEVIEWSPDSKFVAFSVSSPAPTEHILVVDADKGSVEYVSEAGKKIQVDEEAETDPPFSYEFIRWEAPHTICFSFQEQNEQCTDAQSVVSQGN